MRGILNGNRGFGNYCPSARIGCILLQIRRREMCRTFPKLATIFKAADGKVTLLIVRVKLEPQYLVY
jgi:hypothetical protein